MILPLGGRGRGFDSRWAPAKKIFYLSRLIKEINKKKILCNKQIGFRRGYGTELNLLKLRQRVSDLKKEKNYFTKYLVFIDLKSL